MHNWQCFGFEKPFAIILTLSVGIVDGVATVVLSVKDFGVVAANADPLHAGLPWAAVCCVLPVLAKDISALRSTC